MPKLDLWPMLEQLSIKTKGARVQKLRRDDPFAWAQRELVREIERQYNAGLPVRILVLKGRQIGCSTLTEAILFLWCFLHPGTNAIVLSKTQSDSDYLFSMTKRYWEDGPFKGVYDLKYDRVGYLEWLVTNSSILTATAKNSDPGRGRTIQACHMSELAYWPEENEIARSLMEAIPYEHGTIVVMESTPNGVGGYFHDEWTKAIARESTFQPFFFPWFCHEEYQIPGTQLRYNDLDEEEQDIMLSHKLSLAQLAWRRRKLQSYTEPIQFRIEYPCTPEEGFVSTGTNVFNLNRLRECYQPDVECKQGYLFNNNGRLEWIDTPTGHTFVYRDPDPRRARRYVVAVDPTWTLEGDPACIQVLDRASMEQVAVWHGSGAPEDVGNIALALAHFYGPECILNTEVQGGGKRVLHVWRTANYPHIALDFRPDRLNPQMKVYGWMSTYESKRLMIATMQGNIVHRRTTIHHPATYYELARYVMKDDGSYGPARRSGHDDCVTSLGIAMITCLEYDKELDWTAMAAPPPARIPGESPPFFAHQGRPFALPEAPIDRYGVGYEPDDLIGVDVVY